ncbi:penicillin acylase family protein [Siccirubricoccus sp. KC 17139]|uniref:Penicillin acylase family protein n=1 Tax=Siccirubricoccus soli TaxID=2899147 RepID=A0ABT1D0S4_9PROT|nr:penicillin acylase family protein [Siccirubricoccus soli]MCO6415526.1 penicillin acylase family protein [Siccirubricoccus soli]MCP2681658.1 penicillin acylase family protein [Siccirubricoccus soli]
MRGWSRQAALLLAIAALLPGCAALFPRHVSVEKRLATLPLRGLPLGAPVTIRWNDHLIPWIEAGSDTDLAMALGLVHGHLRGAQIDLLRHVARGRLAEVAGPLATDIDHALRILDFGRPAPAIIAAWPRETRDFVDAFLVGLNHAIRHGPRPPEAGLLGLRREPLTREDLLAIGRLAGTDINWLGYFSLLAERGTPGFARAWQRLLVAGTGLAPANAGQVALGGLLTGLSRQGSNAVAVDAAHSESGAALLAADPHLGLSLPNLWLLAGMRSPSFHAVGMMVPGLPILGLGRNPDLAWGGTNLRAASSDLFAVAGLPLEEREVTIRQRLWFATTRRVRVSPQGPVITDATIIPNPAGEQIALRWAGHEPADEITALLRAARARNGGEFRAAFAGFAVSPQNMLWADRSGRIGRLTAALLPDRAGFPATDPVLDARDPAATAPWTRLRDAGRLPALEDPREGFLASANENPALWAPDAPPIGYFFSDGDRVARLRALLAARPKLSVADLAALQRDRVAPKAAALAEGLLARLDALPGGAPDPALLAPLRGWDGDYAAESRAALIFELLIGQLVPALQPEGVTARGPETGWNFITTFLLRDLDALPPARRDAVLRAAVAGAAPLAARHANWGEVHRLRAAHWLVNLPLLGRAFVLGSDPVGGSRETPMKTGHGLVAGPHEVSFGAMARQVSDLGDSDANWFVLFGGQDGFLGSAAFADQIPLWREGRSIRLPLRPETVAREFPHVTVLRP